MLGKNIKRLRAAKKLNQTELGYALSVSKQSISNWKNEKIMPSVEMLMKIAEYFAVSTDFLLGIEKKDCIDTEGLTPEQIAHIKFLINDMKNKKGRAVL